MKKDGDKMKRDGDLKRRRMKKDGDKMKSPETKKQVKQILGLFSYYRHFVNNFAHIAKPLSDLTKKILPHKVTWTLIKRNLVL